MSTDRIKYAEKVKKLLPDLVEAYLPEVEPMTNIFKPESERDYRKMNKVDLSLGMPFKTLSLVLLILLTGCTTTQAWRDGDTMYLKGFGAKRAKWADGAELERSEPVKVPDIVVPGAGG